MFDSFYFSKMRDVFQRDTMALLLKKSNKFLSLLWTGPKFSDTSKNASKSVHMDPNKAFKSGNKKGPN